jgi:F-type H+-transporting ATPase subunit alpha
LDAATKSVLEKGARNVEILKQGQFSPLSVEKQIAIIYCGTKGLLRDVPVNKIREFETEYLMVLENRHPQVLSDLRAGKYTDEITGLLESVAKDVAKKFAS